MSNNDKGHKGLKVAGQPGIISDADRTFERTQGCWNCKSWNNKDLSIGSWTGRRQGVLMKALEISLSDSRGEEAPACVDIRRMVDRMDKSVACGEIGVCLKGAAEADFVHNAYLCDQWSGATGASVARAGQAPDLLPEELREKTGIN